MIAPLQKLAAGLPQAVLAANSSSQTRAAIRLVCAAGLASTQLPATSAAATWPRKIASGKFHGLMQAKMPRPSKNS